MAILFFEDKKGPYTCRIVLWQSFSSLFELVRTPTSLLNYGCYPNLELVQKTKLSIHVVRCTHITKWAKHEQKQDNNLPQINLKISSILWIKNMEKSVTLIISKTGDPGGYMEKENTGAF